MPTTDYAAAGAAQLAAGELRDMPAEMTEILRTGKTELGEARAWEPDRSERDQWNKTRIHNERMDRRAKVGQRVMPQIDQMERRVAAAETAIGRYTAGAADGPDDATSIARETRAFERVRQILDTGQRGAAQIIADAKDVDTLRGLRRELPAYLIVQHLSQRNRAENIGAKGVQALTDTDPDPAEFLDAIDRRLVEMLPKPEGDRLRLALDAPHLVAGMRERVRGMRSEFREGGAGGLLSSALRARVIEKQGRQGSAAPAA